MKEYSRLHCSHIHTFVRIFFSQLRPFICNTRVVCGWKKVEIEADWNILNRIYHWQYICILYTVHKNDVYYVIHLILNARQIMDVGNRLADLIWLEVSVAWVAAKEGNNISFFSFVATEFHFDIYHDAFCCLLHQDVVSFELSVCKHTLSGISCTIQNETKFVETQPLMEL